MITNVIATARKLDVIELAGAALMIALAVFAFVMAFVNGAPILCVVGVGVAGLAVMIVVGGVRVADLRARNDAARVDYAAVYADEARLDAAIARADVARRVELQA